MDFKKTALGLIVFGVLLAGLAGGVFLAQQQTQLRSQAGDDSEPCTVENGCLAPPGGTAPPPPGTPPPPTAPPPPSGGSDACSISCGACPSRIDQCGNTVFEGTCDYSTCTSPSATYFCTSSSNSNCRGEYECGISCIGISNPPPPPTAPPPAGGTNPSGSISFSTTTISRQGNSWQPVTINYNANNAGSVRLLYLNNGTCRLP